MKSNNKAFELLGDKVKSREAVISIIGLGYVGLPLALEFVESGFEVIGFDTDKVKVNNLKKNKTYIEHISSSKIKKAISKSFFPTTDFKKIKKTDFIILCVPTPLNKQREPDLKYIEETLDTISPYLKEHQCISLESTTYPGTTEQLIATEIAKLGFKIGHDFYVIYSPEREDPGNKEFIIQQIPKVVSGISKNCLHIAELVYGSVFESVIKVSNTRTAEMTKLLENIFRSVNIGLVNEMKKISDKMNINIHEVIKAAETKPFGFTAFYPGPGIGGHCIPIDPFYLTWKAKEYGVNTKFIELAGEINAEMPQYVIDKATEILNLHRKTVKGSKILILGIAYKKNVDDMRESPAVIIMEKLRKMGALINYHDPHVKKFPKMREHNFDLKSIKLNKFNISKYDLVILTTDHDQVDYKFIKSNAKLIVDTRGVYMKKNNKITLA